MRDRFFFLDSAFSFKHSQTHEFDLCVCFSSDLSCVEVAQSCLEVLDLVLQLLFVLYTPLKLCLSLLQLVPHSQQLLNIKKKSG